MDVELECYEYVSGKVVRYFEEDISTRGYSWFYKDTSRNESEDIVEKDGREGCFMVRDSSRPGVYTLTILVKTGGLVIGHNSCVVNTVTVVVALSLQSCL